MAKNSDTLPIEVIILTADHDIKGTVYVYRVRKGGTDMYNIFNDIVELYNS